MRRELTHIAVTGAFLPGQPPFTKPMLRGAAARSLVMPPRLRHPFCMTHPLRPAAPDHPARRRVHAALHNRFRNAAAALFCLCALPAVAQQRPPPFDNTAGTVFDIIRADDPTTFVCLDELGRAERQIWDKRVDGEPVVLAYLFQSQYADGTSIEIAINPEFGSDEMAREQAELYAPALGRLPTALRAGIKRFSVHEGRRGYHAGTGGIVVYAQTTENRLSYDHLEESLFHEAVHASWDRDHRLAPEWIAAQQSDGMFLTRYGQKSPEREDLAETALFAFAILHHPDRFPPVDTQVTRHAVPARIAYVAELLPVDRPLIWQIGPPQGCAAQK